MVSEIYRRQWTHSFTVKSAKKVKYIKVKEEYKRKYKMKKVRKESGTSA